VTWDEAVAFALTLPGAEVGRSYGQPAIKTNGHAFLGVGHERDTSFVLRLDHDTVALMMEVHPDTFWKTPHYAGYPAVLVRYAAPDAAIVREMIVRAHAQALAAKPPRVRRR